jgi:hypothetical protein
MKCPREKTCFENDISDVQPSFQPDSWMASTAMTDCQLELGTLIKTANSTQLQTNTRFLFYQNCQLFANRK